jgi:hypothetical protein
MKSSVLNIQSYDSYKYVCITHPVTKCCVAWIFSNNKLWSFINPLQLQLCNIHLRGLLYIFYMSHTSLYITLLWRGSHLTLLYFELVVKQIYSCISSWNKGLNAYGPEPDFLCYQCTVDGDCRMLQLTALLGIYVSVKLLWFQPGSFWEHVVHLFHEGNNLQKSNPTPTTERVENMLCTLAELGTKKT